VVQTLPRLQVRVQHRLGLELQPAPPRLAVRLRVRHQLELELQPQPAPPNLRGAGHHLRPERQEAEAVLQERCNGSDGASPA
jgi:hypothetical protein